MKKIILLLILTLIFVSLGLKISNSQETGWRTYRGTNERLGYSDEEFRPPLEEKWHYLGNALFTSPIAVDDVVYAGCGDKSLYAFDKRSGDVLWTFDTDGAIIGTPAFSDGKLYFGSIDENFYCVDISNHKTYLWKMRVYSKITKAPLVTNHYVYFGAENGIVYCVDKDTGDLVWNYSTGGKINSAISGDDRGIYFVSQDGYLYALHPLTKEVLFKKLVGKNVKATPVILGDYVYLLNTSGQFRALNRENKGHQDWYFNLNEDTVTTPAISGDLAIIAGIHGKVACIDLKTGKAKWTRNLPSGFDASPVVTDRYVFIGDKTSTLYMLSLEDGTISWQEKFDKGFHTDFCLYKDYLFTTGEDFSVRAFSSQPPPYLKVEPTTLDFGEVDVNSKMTLSFRITNTGGGTLTGTIEPSLFWIKVYPREFTGNDVIVKVTVDTEGFDPEKKYQGKVIVKSNGGNQDVLIVLKTKGLPPKLSVTPKLLDFGSINAGGKKNMVLFIKNLGGGELNGTLSTDVKWVELSSLNFKGNDVKIMVTINGETLKAGESYKGHIYIESNGGDETVELNVKVVEANPEITVDTINLNFGEIEKGSSETRVFTISNKGGGTLEGTLKTSAPWIILSQTTFSGNSIRITVRIDSTDLSRGEYYTGTITINSNGGTKKIDVYVKIKEEKIVLKLKIGSKIMYVNDTPLEMDVSPIIREGRTLLPIRYIAEPLGAEVGWDGTEKKVTVSLDDIFIELWIGRSTARVNGVEKPIDPNNPKVKPIIVPPGRTMLPVRFVAENLGCKVDWEGETRTVIITYEKP